MKKLLYLALVLILPTSILVADSGDHRIEGYWFSTHANYEIEIKSKLYGLKVKGLPGNRNNWKKLRSTSRHNVFKDHLGNVLIRDDRHRLIYKTTTHRGRGHRDGRTYVFSRDLYNANNYYGGDNRTDDRRYYDENRDRGNTYNDSYRDDYTDRGPSASSIRNTVSGQWKTIGLNKTKRVEIRKVQTGINARFKHSDKTVFYAQDRSDPNVFTDRRGNRYILKRDLSLKWIGINGKEYELKKY